MEEPNEIDIEYVGWALKNKKLLAEGKVDPETAEAVQESIDRVKGMFAEFDEWAKECVEESIIFKENGGLDFEE